MRTFQEKIWKDGEYTYEAAYGFVPNIMAYLHDDDPAKAPESAVGEGEVPEVSEARLGETDSGAGKRVDARPCLLVAPGGGYCMTVPPEGEVVAKEFYGRGMNCFVLTYTTDITMSVPLRKQPMSDIARAVRYLRANAERFGIDPARIVICGFSAGAHVCASLGVHYMDIEDPDPALQAFSNRPDAMILSYPVITSGKFTHEYSIQALVGKDAPAADRAYFSCEDFVTSDTPPCFIWQTVEDDLVPVENSMMFAEKCRAAGVPYTYHAFPRGWHGLSVCNDAWRAGEHGESYTMDQVMRAVDAVRKGEGIRVSEQRRQELMEQFPENGNPPAPMVLPLEYPDVALWPQMAETWMAGVFTASKK